MANNGICHGKVGSYLITRRSRRSFSVAGQLQPVTSTAECFLVLTRNIIKKKSTVTAYCVYRFVEVRFYSLLYIYGKNVNSNYTGTR